MPYDCIKETSCKQLSYMTVISILTFINSIVVKMLILDLDCKELCETVISTLAFNNSVVVMMLILDLNCKELCETVISRLGFTVYG